MILRKLRHWHQKTRKVSVHPATDYVGRQQVTDMIGYEKSILEEERPNLWEVKLGDAAVFSGAKLI